MPTNKYVAHGLDITDYRGSKTWITANYKFRLLNSFDVVSLQSFGHFIFIMI